MVPNGDRQGQKILQLGQGSLDLELLKTIRASGYQGPIGILGHTQDDAEARLEDNLDGLHWLLPQLDGKLAGPKPPTRTPVPGAKPGGSPAAVVAPNVGGWLIAGRDEYRTPPLAIEVTAKLTGAGGYNILVACDTKQSGAHWELFTMPQTGFLTAYLPGYEPDHVRTTLNVADGKPHAIAMAYEADRVRLFIDGKLAADEAVKSRGKPIVAGDLAVGRLVEGTMGATGTVLELKLARGAALSENLIGRWLFNDDKAAEVADASPLKNPAKRAAAAPEPPKNRAPKPPPGVHLKPVDPRLKATLLDRSSSDVYMGVKVDEAGNLFVGGREAVFVFERETDGTFAQRRELLRFPPDSIIMGLEFRHDDLYVLTDNALYLVPQGRVARTGLKPRRILWGLPLDLHVSFHCLAWGPDGLLYLTHGDPLLQYGDWTRPDHWGHWTLYCGVENTPLPYTGQGAVLRMKPDGTDVHVVARGLRGPVGLAFDADGNLFTNDNDHESRADQYAPSRLLHVVDGVDFGWPRGWMASKSPDRYDLIEPVCDLGRGAPCDLTYYDRPLLGDVVGDRLLMCRWDSFRVTAYRPEPKGMTFTAVEETVAVGDENCRPVGICADRDGRLYVTALYMTGNQAAPDCVSDLIVIERANAAGTTSAKPPREHVAPYVDRHVLSPFADEPNERQIAIALWAVVLSADDLRKKSNDIDEETRLAATLAIGRKLTVPVAHF
jgi:glucose/arabinose dehydrogenase